jgi:CBS domain containing-hemolysin-like protein
VAKHIIHHLDAYLSAIQLAITMVNLALGWVGESFVAEMFYPIFTRLRFSDPAVHSASFVIAFLLMTFLTIVVGELVPKSLALQHTKSMTLWVAFPLRLFCTAFSPLIWLLNGTTRVVLKLIGLHPASESTVVHSEEELRLLLAHSHEKEVSALARRLALRAFDLRTRIVRQIMLPRRQVVYLDLRRSLAENLRVARESKHTRFPLCDGGLDQVAGMVHMKDLLWAIQQASQADLTKVKRDVLVVPETTGLERLLTTFQRSHHHMAIVVDEYGSTVGMVTIEDVIEELVGEIQDEFDQEAPLIQDLGNGEFVADGMVPLRQFNVTVGASFQSEDVDTLSGYLVAHLGRLPTENESFALDGFVITVKKMGRRRIHQLHLKRVEPAANVGA